LIEKFDKAIDTAILVIPFASNNDEKAELDGSVVKFWSLI
jgi:hypothetical protein